MRDCGRRTERGPAGAWAAAEAALSVAAADGFDGATVCAGIEIGAGCDADAAGKEASCGAAEAAEAGADVVAAGVEVGAADKAGAVGLTAAGKPPPAPGRARAVGTGVDMGGEDQDDRSDGGSRWRFASEFG